MKPQPILSVKNLTKVYEPERDMLFRPQGEAFVAVNNVSFAMENGEILGLLGPNGAGKTTTIQMLLSTLTPTSGEIKFFGQSLFTHRSEILQYVSFASTYIKLPHRLTVYENLDVYGMLYGVSKSDRQTRIKKFLTFFGVWNQRDKDMGALSAGQTTRVMLAKAFLAYPRVALLDEPTASLDPDMAHEVRSFVLEQRREYGVSILFTSHNMDEVSEVCDRILFLSNGKIIANDTPSNLAASIKQASVELIVGDGLKRTIEYVVETGIPYEVDGRSIVLQIDEQDIAKLLMNLAKTGVHYTQISVKKPTLEDYFLHVARGKV